MKPGFIFVTRQDDLDRAVDAARSAGTVGLDTEFLREKTYRAKLCLVQLAAGDDIFVVDVLEPLDLKGLADLVADPDVRVLLHAGRQDLELFYEGWGAVPANIFDVQLAAGFAGHGASLPYGRLVETACATERHGTQPHGAHLGPIVDGVQHRGRWGTHARRGHAFHRRTVTRVPTPRVDVSANSFTRRRAPGSPSPMPPPVE